MTRARVAFVDVYILRGAGQTLETLLLRRAAGQKRAGSWEAVHGKIDGEEPPHLAARREFLEETGCTTDRFYNVSRVEQFYLPLANEIALIPVFVAFVSADTSIVLSEEHDTFEWLPIPEAQRRCSWPRAVRALEDAERLLGTGGGGVLEEVLRIP